MAIPTVNHNYFGWTWSPVLAGLFTSLVVQILLVILGFGIGLLSIDVPTTGAAPASAGWVVFGWWAISGIIAAFLGGAVAAANSPDQSSPGRIGHALAAWAVTTVVVIGASALTAGSTANIASNLAGPTYVETARIASITRSARTETTGSANVNQQQIEEARRQFAYVMLASFIGLLLGAGAAYAAGRVVTARAVNRSAESLAGS